MSRIAIIGGTGLSQLDGLAIIESKAVSTPFGTPSSELLIGDYHGNTLIFLPRHGQQHQIPPHKINYRANIWALKQQGVEMIVAVAAVGGISDDMAPGVLAVPDQIIDYTYGREHSFFSEDFSSDNHIDFTYPYEASTRQKLLTAGEQTNIVFVNGGTYGAVQGPRLETAAEIQRMAQDGCTMVGMTGMPEASLARELELAYATCAVSANWAAGFGQTAITIQEIENTVVEGMNKIKKMLLRFIQTV